MFELQNSQQLRVICTVPGCGYRSRDTYGSTATAETTAAWRLATTHARKAHGEHNNMRWETRPDGTRYGYRLVRVEAES